MSARLFSLELVVLGMLLCPPALLSTTQVTAAPTDPEFSPSPHEASTCPTTGSLGIDNPRGVPGENRVSVCLEGGLGFRAIGVATTIASNMFAAIGVTLEWQTHPRGCSAQGIHISVTEGAPEAFTPNALASTLPFEPNHIRVFYDRVHERDPSPVSRLLAHVLVHEIAHVLQEGKPHTDRGVMKAKWGPKDFEEMRRRPLEFTQEDIIEIHRRLAVRGGRDCGMNAARRNP